MTDMISNIKMGVDAGGVETGVTQVKQSLGTLRKAATDATQGMADGFRAVGTESDAAAVKSERAARRLTDEFKNAIFQQQTLGKSLADKLEMKIAFKGLDPARYQSLLTELKALEAAQGKVNGALQSTLPVMQQVGMSANATAAAMRNVPAQFTDIITSLQGGQQPLTVLLQQGGQLKDMFGGVGNAARALGGYVLGLLSPFTLAAGAAAVLGFAYYQGSQEANGYNKALLLSGNAAGTTAGQMQVMAQRMSSIAGTQGAAAEALTAFAAAGSVAAINLERFASSAIIFERTTGTAIADTVKSFTELKKAPLEASLKLNESMRYLTVSLYEQIRALEGQGNATAAADLAQKAFADTLDSRSAEMEGRLGIIARSWIAIKNAVLGAGDALAGIGRDNGINAQIEAQKAIVAQLERPGATMRVFGNLTAPVSDAAKKAARDALAQMQTAAGYEATSAALQRDSAATVEKIAKWRKDGLDYATQTEKRDKAIRAEAAAGLDLFNKGLISSAELSARLVGVQEKFKDKTAPKPKAQSDAYGMIAADIWKADAASQQFLDTTAKLEESDKFRIESLDKIAEAWRKGNITLDQAVVLESAMNDAQQKRVLVETTLRDLEQQKADIADTAKALESVEKTTDALLKQIETERLQVASLGLTKDAVAALEVAKLLEQATSKDRLATIAEEIDWSGALSEQYKAQATALRELASLKTQGGAKEVAIEAAKKSADEWKRTADKIENSITDALMRGFENGKTFAENLRDVVVNMFKTLVLQPVVSAIVNPVAQGITGMVLGGSASAGTLSDGLNAVSSANSLSKLGGWFTNFGSSATDALYKAGEKVYSMGFESLGKSMMGNIGEAGGFSAMADKLQTVGNGLGYLNATLLAANGQWGAAIGAGIGTYFGGPIGSVLGQAVGGFIDNAFGGGHEYTTGQGIQGNFSKSGFSGNNYQTWHNNGSSGFLGIGGSGSSSGKNLSALDGGTQTTLSVGFAAIQLQAAAMADSLGLSVKAIENYSQDISVALGSDAVANQKAIDAMFASVADGISTAVAPSIAGLAKSGETASTTLSRLSTSILTSNAWLTLLKEKLFAVSLAGGDAASKLADAFGGLDKLTASSQAFYDAYFSNTEKIANNQTQMTDALAAFGIALPTSKQALRDLAGSLDLNTDAGRAAYATLLKLAPEFSSTTDLIAAESKSAAASLLKAFTGTAFDKTVIQFSALASALSSANITTFAETIGQVFDSLASRIASVVDSIQTERTAVADAVQQILAPGAMSMQAIAAGVAGVSGSGVAAATATSALLGYQEALQGFALDAAKGVSKLSTLRAETVKYYESQKSLAELMQTSATGLLTTVSNYRFSQLTPDAQATNLQAQFTSAYSMALASQGDGNSLATYADKLNTLLTPLIDSLQSTGQDALINRYLAQADATAKLLEANAPQNYQAESLAMLDSIDKALAALDVSSQSAESVISAAVTAGADRTAAGLAAVIAAIGGKTVPAFAGGGSYGGGMALVGETGPELINFGQPGRVYTSAQTQGMFGSNGRLEELVAQHGAQLEAMSYELRAIASASNKSARILERLTPDGVSLQTVAA